MTNRIIEFVRTHPNCTADDIINNSGDPLFDLDKELADMEEIESCVMISECDGKYLLVDDCGEVVK